MFVEYGQHYSGGTHCSRPHTVVLVAVALVRKTKSPIIAAWTALAAVLAMSNNTLPITGTLVAALGAKNLLRCFEGDLDASTIHYKSRCSIYHPDGVNERCAEEWVDRKAVEICIFIGDIGILEH